MVSSLLYRSISRVRSATFASSSCRPGLQSVAGRACFLVEARIRDRHGSVVGQQDQQVLIVLAEGLGTDLVGEVEIAHGLTLEHDGNSQQTSHRGMVGWEAVATRIVTDIGNPQRCRIFDQRSQ